MSVWRRRSPFLLVAVVAALLLSLTFAGVFVYYPITIAIQPTTPPIKFDEGSNANRDDLSGKISVTVSENKTSLTITVHPTYQATYYKNISLIRNTDQSKSYTVYLKVVNPMTGLPPGSKVILYVYEKSATRSSSGWPSSNLSFSGSIGNVSLTSSGTSQGFTIGANKTLEMDLLVYLPGGQTLPGNASASVYLVYTTSPNESPP